MHFAALIVAVITLVHGHGIAALLTALGGAAAFGTLITVPHPNPLIPSTSPDNPTILAQARNLTAQFEVLTGTTDAIQGGGGSLSALGAVGAAIPVTGKSLLNAGAADACTLATPVAGDPAAGGNDGLQIEIIDISGKAHTVTTAANKINGNKAVATFPGTKGARINLVAFNGVWYTDGGGTVLT